MALAGSGAHSSVSPRFPAAAHGGFSAASGPHDHADEFDAAAAAAAARHAATAAAGDSCSFEGRPVARAQPPAAKTVTANSVRILVGTGR